MIKVGSVQSSVRIRKRLSLQADTVPFQGVRVGEQSAD